jgi:hypothetical protein
LKLIRFVHEARISTALRGGKNKPAGRRADRWKTDIKTKTLNIEL